MTYLKKGLRGVVILFTLTILASIVGYATRAILARGLEPSQYGLFYSAYSLIMFLLLFTNIGFPSALVKYVSEFKAKKEYGKVKFTILLTSITRIIITLVVAIILFILSNILAKYYFKNNLASSVIIIFSVIIIVMTLNRILENTFNSIQNNLFMGLVDFCIKFFLLIFIIIFIFSGFAKNALLPTYALLIAVILAFIVFIVPSIKQTKILKVKAEKSKKLVKKLFVFASASFLTSLSYMVISHVDTIMLTSFRSLEEVGIYNVVLPTVTLISLVGVSIGKVFFPMASELWTHKLKDKLRIGFELLRKYTLIIVTPLSLVMLTFPKTLINLLFGSNYTSGYLAMQILALGVIFSTIAIVSNSLLKGIGKPKEVTKILLTAALFNIITNALLIPLLGIVGAAITTTLSFLIMMLMSSIKIKKFVKISFNKSVWIRVILSSILFILVINIGKHLLSLNQYLEAIICLLVAGIVYLSSCFILRLLSIKETKHFIKEFLSK
jgi:O-antigen/teichoic acid export membrane protein